MAQLRRGDFGTGLFHEGRMAWYELPAASGRGRRSRRSGRRRVSQARRLEQVVIPSRRSPAYLVGLLQIIQHR